MPTKQITTQFGHSLAPEGPHTITFHVPGWDSIVAFRAGDPAILSQMRSIYPRFGPFFEARELAAAIHAKLGLSESQGVLPFVDPAAFALAGEYAFSKHRAEGQRLVRGELGFRVVDVGGVRVFVVVYPMAKMKGVIGIWQNQGYGVSTRLGAELLKSVEGMRVVEWEGVGGEGEGLEGFPEATYLPEGEAHRELRERIVGLLKRAAVGGGEGGVEAGDVFLEPTGMAAVWRLYRGLASVRKGAVVALGAIFHSSWHLFEEAEGGFKHFGDVGEGVVDRLEEYVQGEKAEGRDVSFVFLEFPSNPLLESIDLKKLRALADKYGFPLVVDDTVGSFCNVDVLPVADVLISSLTKSFSGYANVMGGSITLNPSSSHYPLFKPTFTSIFHNLLYEADATQLLHNSADYLSRSTILNRNALALATFFHSHSRAIRPSSPLTKVLYPPFLTTLPNYKAFMRPATDEFTPGYGCLLSIDFITEKAARAFYEAVRLHKSPHLGAHETLVLNFNECAWGDNKELAEYQASFGAKMDQVRISVGLEDADLLVGTVKAALEVAEAAENAEANGV
ncbi:cystathionine gamma-synthase [Cercophora newfieldiana]|uniref:Cystathionine gamma-synthase n=1 Tax=Cercophora newfieldiana TaxID=92897 RepID=A0AA39YN97_9PEZI|nr:cystathionine gamma-synthase [Cercophora newfieldiana]